MIQYLITPYQGKPYILNVPKNTTMVAFEAAMTNRHKSFYDSHRIDALQKKELKSNGTMEDVTAG